MLREPSTMAHVENIWIYPIKGLDPIERGTADVTEAGTLRGDRAYALVDPAGETLNGKQTDRLHEITAAFDPETKELTLSADGTDDDRRFELATERDAAGEWFSEFVGEQVELRRRGPPAFVDRPTLGPSVISTGTLEEVASWFDGMTVEGARRRFRPNIEVGGVPPFWEDRFLGDDPSGFEIDGIRFEGAKACARCVVPSRDPNTGEPIEEFRRRFVERRRETLPAWVDEDAFEHLYTLMLITAIPETDRGGTIRVSDGIESA
jgi:uncharacterized protein YcbX